MTRQTPAAFLTALLGVVSALTGGCRSHPAPSAQPPRVSSASLGDGQLPKVFLPDLSSSEPSVRQQLGDSYALLLRLKEEEAEAARLADAHGQLGRLLLAAEFTDAARSALANAQALAPADMQWPYYLGLLSEATGDAVGARVAFEQAHRIAPDDVPTMLHLGSIQADLGSQAAAEALFGRILEVDAASTAAHHGLGRVALARRQYARAVEALETVLRLDPQASSVNYPLAMAYRGLGDRDAAEARLRRHGPGVPRFADPLKEALTEVLQSGVSYRLAGTRALERGEWPAAIKYFRAAIALTPDPVAHHKLGTALFAGGDVEGALEHFRESVRLSPTFAKGHFSLGIVMASAGRYGEAAGHLSKAVRFDPGDAGAWLQLAHLTRRSGQPQHALALYRRVLTLDTGNAEAQFGYATSLLRLSRFGEAGQALTEGMSRFPGEWSFPLLLARLLAAAPDDRIRNGRRALRLAQELLGTGRQGAELSETMAMALAEIGDFGAAVSWQRKAVEEARRTEDPLLSSRERSLKQFEAEKPSREPWRTEEALEFPPAG